VVGALIGAGIAGIGLQEISFKYLRRVVISWFVSPAVSSALCFLFILIVSLLTLNGLGLQLKTRLLNLTLISGTLFMIMTYMVLVLI